MGMDSSGGVIINFSEVFPELFSLNFLLLNLIPVLLDKSTLV